ncbi:MAG: hypothetical protein WA792_09245, partial [Pseudolabrys sp.]
MTEWRGFDWGKSPRAGLYNNRFLSFRCRGGSDDQERIHLTTAYINRVATTVPPHDVHAVFRSFAQSSFKDRRNSLLFRRMADKSGIEHRYSCLAPDELSENEGANVFYSRGN